MSRRGHYIGALWTTLYSLLNIAFGILFQSILANRLGVSTVTDVFQAGTTFPSSVATAILGSLPIVLLPEMARRSAKNEPPLGPRFYLLGMAVLGAFSVVVAAASNPLANVIAPGFHGAKHGALAGFLAITSPTPVLAWIAGLGQARAYEQHHFAKAAAGPVVNGIVLLGCTVGFFTFSRSVTSLAVATLAGYIAQALLMSREVRELMHAGSRRDRDFHSATVISIAVMVGASVIYKGQPIVERLIGSTVGAGVPAELGFAAKISQGLSLVAGMGLSTVLMPVLSRALATDDRETAKREFAFVVAGTVAMTALVTSIAWLSSADLVTVLYGHGKYTARDVTDTRELLVASLLTVACGSITGPLNNLHYAANRQRWVARFGVITLVVGALMSWALSRPLHGPGVLLGTGLGAVFGTAVFARAVSGSLPGWRWRSWIWSQRHAALVLGLSVAAGYGVSAAMRAATSSRPSTPIALVHALSVSITVVGVFAALGALVGWPSRNFYTSLLRLIRRVQSSPSSVD